jgi:hypothetical protein
MDNGQSLLREAGHGAAFQAEEMGMAAGAALVPLRVGNVAKSPVHALNRVNEPGFFQVLQGSKDRHPVQVIQKVSELTMREQPPGCLERGQHLAARGGGSDARFPEQLRRFHTPGHGVLYHDIRDYATQLHNAGRDMPCGRGGLRFGPCRLASPCRSAVSGLQRRFQPRR